jgi:hypothetical protein
MMEKGFDKIWFDTYRTSYNTEMDRVSFRGGTLLVVVPRSSTLPVEIRPYQIGTVWGNTPNVGQIGIW